MITKAMSVYCSTSLKNTAKMQKKKKICKMSTPFHICACIKKIMSIPCIPSPDFFPAAIDRKGLLFLNAHYSPALLGGGKEKANWVAKRLVPHSPSQKFCTETFSNLGEFIYEAGILVRLFPLTLSGDDSQPCAIHSFQKFHSMGNFSQNHVVMVL